MWVPPRVGEVPSPPGCQPPALPTRGHCAPSGTRGFRNLSVKAGPALLQLAGPSFPESVRGPGTHWGFLCEAAGAQAQASSSWCKAFSHAASGDCRTGTGSPGHSVQTRLGSSLKPLLPVGPHPQRSARTELSHGPQKRDLTSLLGSLGPTPLPTIGLTVAAPTPN